MSKGRSRRDERLVQDFREWFERQPSAATALAEKVGVSPNTLLRLLPDEGEESGDDWKRLESSTREALMVLMGRLEGPDINTPTEETSEEESA